MRPILLAVLLLLVAVAWAGCLQQNEDPAAGADTGGWQGGSEYGVRMNEVTLHERITPGTAKTWTFQAENRAPSDNPVEYNAACAGPFVVTLLGPEGQELQYEEPRADCQARDMQVLTGGETLDHSWTWDGRIWADGAMTTPSAGVYTIQVTFEGFHDGNPDHMTDGAMGETTVYVEG